MFRHVVLIPVLLCGFAIPAGAATAPPANPDARKAAYVEAATRGEGLLPWQSAEPTADELAFREAVERRKDTMLAGRRELARPAITTAEQAARARRNAEATEWGKAWASSRISLADALIAQPAGYVESMIEELTPGFDYGFTCPNCVGKQSQEGESYGLLNWDWRDPEKIQCVRCRQTYPDEKFPETSRVVLPRLGQTITYYMNDAERANPEDRSGKLAYKWIGQPFRISFSGIVRYYKARFMLTSVNDLAWAYMLTGDERYARMGIEILQRFAACYRNWAYHDVYHNWYDCDPLYATWNDSTTWEFERVPNEGAIPLEFKRSFFTEAYKKDTLEKAGTVEGYFCAGRFYPSTDNISVLGNTAIAYDILHDAKGADGKPLWTGEGRRRVERDLFLEWVIGGEPFVGGEGQAVCTSNKAPRIYLAQAAVGRALDLPALIDTALRGEAKIIAEAFRGDGLSQESPAYTNMFVQEMVHLPEVVVGYEWPAGFAGRSGTVDPYGEGSRFGMMLRGLIDQLRPDGNFIPLADTENGRGPSQSVIEVGLRRYPEHFRGLMKTLGMSASSTYAVLNLEPEAIGEERPLNLPEILYPNWMTAILRHGQGEGSALLALTFSPPGGHRQPDNLSLYYEEAGEAMLGDLGYVGDSPMNDWIRCTYPHNLVIVDGKEQYGAGRSSGRTPRLEWMTTAPELSAVEASSKVYDATSEYRRTVVMLKGPERRTVAVDIFRVAGGNEHAYQLFSNVAASESGAEGKLEFAGLTLPPEGPMPETRGSVKREDIYGLRDERKADPAPAGPWQATWSDPKHRYRVWMLSEADEVVAANAPGQDQAGNSGRRLRALRVIRRGEGLKSAFVAVHEPGAAGEAARVTRAEHLEVPAAAGEHAVAVKLATAWGEYLVLSDFAGEAEIEGVRFKGALGVRCRPAGGKEWLLGCAAETLKSGETGVAGATARWVSGAKRIDAATLEAATARPADWPPEDGTRRSWALTEVDGFRTGYPVAATESGRVRIERFPLPEETGRFELPAVRYFAGQ